MSTTTAERIDLLSISDVAAELGISRSSVYRAMQAGRLGYVQLPYGPRKVARWQLDEMIRNSIRRAD